jgi:ubiquinol-cytochrome c reductase cytochrome c1 subunit
MVRLGALAVGLFFVIAVLWGAVQPRDAVPPDPIKEAHQHPEKIAWTHNGPGNLGIFGTFDRKQLQRGFQVYREVCSACHSINRIAFRDLADLGFSPAEIKAAMRSRRSTTMANRQPARARRPTVSRSSTRTKPPRVRRRTAPCRRICR